MASIDMMSTPLQEIESGYLNRLLDRSSSCPAPMVQNSNPLFITGGEASCIAPKVQTFNSPLITGGEASIRWPGLLLKRRHFPPLGSRVIDQIIKQSDEPAVL